MAAIPRGVGKLLRAVFLDCVIRAGLILGARVGVVDCLRASYKGVRNLKIPADSLGA